MNGLTRALRATIAGLDAVSGAVGVIVAWLIIPLTAITAYEVFARYVLAAPTAWSYELGYMLTGSYFLLGAAYALREDAHIRIDVIYNRFGRTGQAVANLIGFGAVVLPTLAVLTVALWRYAALAYESGERSGESYWNPIVWPFRFTFFAGFLLLGLQSLAQLLKALVDLTGARRAET